MKIFKKTFGLDPILVRHNEILQVGMTISKAKTKREGAIFIINQHNEEKHLLKDVKVKSFIDKITKLYGSQDTN